MSKTIVNNVFGIPCSILLEMSSIPEKMDDDANENSLTMKILEFAKNVSS
jgi:hypothetical protein